MEDQTLYSSALGFDVRTERLDVCSLPDRKLWSMDYTGPRLKSLIESLALNSP